MTLSVTHSFVSSVPDDSAAGAAGEVVPSNWNAAHALSGTLPAANVGAAGSATWVQFNTSGVLDASGTMVFDKTNAQLHLPGLVGIQKPKLALGVLTDATPYDAGASLLISDDINGNGNINIVSVGAGQFIYTAIDAFVSRGTVASPTASQSGDPMLDFIGNGYANGGYRNACLWQMAQDGAVSGSTVPGRIELWTTPAGGVITKRFVVDSAGNVNIAGLAASQMVLTDASKNLVSAGAKPTITGAKGGNTALASLLTALATLGILTDSTT